MNEQARRAIAWSTAYRETGRMGPGGVVLRGTPPGAPIGWTFGLLPALYGLVFAALVGALPDLLVRPGVAAGTWPR